MLVESGIIDKLGMKWIIMGYRVLVWIYCVNFLCFCVGGLDVRMWISTGVRINVKRFLGSRYEGVRNKVW